jgi:hypothetical protein
LPFSMTATHEFVVPRSMPIIFPMIWILVSSWYRIFDYAKYPLVQKMGIKIVISSLSGLGNRH